MKTNWIKALTEMGMTRIRMDAICAYQEIESEDKLLIYTSDNTMFVVVEDCETITKKLDSNFNVSWVSNNNSLSTHFVHRNTSWRVLCPHESFVHWTMLLLLQVLLRSLPLLLGIIWDPTSPTCCLSKGRYPHDIPLRLPQRVPVQAVARPICDELAASVPKAHCRLDWARDQHHGAIHQRLLWNHSRHHFLSQGTVFCTQFRLLELKH